MDVLIVVLDCILPTVVKTMYSRLYKKQQYEFRKDRSTEQAAYSFINGILQAWNSKSQVAGIFCGLAKALDCVNRDILIEKLQYYRVSETGIDWTKSYLHNIKQTVDININNIQNYSSTWEIVNEEFHRDGF